ncbi:serine hydrolase domain-containing protein [Microbulbifer variabilis]|uniref:serine hydrolase domain-containing protein n=1 Tax=Microbulbifer variabilis TaxID=266805 RepID=UPI001CFDBD06|nr:serine hydrolase domain-containing protein [Microbulbifer variabilis]
MKKLILSIFLLSFSLSASIADALTNRQKSYENILIANVKADEPGVSVIVSRKGKVLYRGARGLANLEHNIPLTADSVFRLGSITKQFTAAAIMILQEQGKLSIRDNIHKYVPDFPTEDNDVTIENLLTHTSGIANYTDDEELFAKEIQVPTTIDDMLVRFSKHPMQFKTGEEMRYSNTGYVLLGKIIEVASGQSYADFIEENIFKKLGMQSSYYGSSKIIPNRANGYDLTPNGVVNAMYIDMMWPHAAGALLSTVSDLNVWFSALREGRLISKKSYKMMTEPFKLNDGSISSYGYGLGVRKFNKYDIIAHGGGIPGFVTDAFYVPSEDLYVAVLSNLSSRNPSFISKLLAAEALDIPVPKFEPIPLDESKVKGFMGSYKVDADSVRTLSLENGKVFSQRNDGPKFEITPMSENSFYFEGALIYIVIEQNEEGKQVMNFYNDLALEPQKAIKI